MHRSIHSEHHESFDMDGKGGNVVGPSPSTAKVLLEMEGPSVVVAVVVVPASSTCSCCFFTLGDEGCAAGFVAGFAMIVSDKTVSLEPPQTCTIGYKTLL